MKLIISENYISTASFYCEFLSVKQDRKVKLWFHFFSSVVLNIWSEPPAAFWNSNIQREECEGFCWSEFVTDSFMVLKCDRMQDCISVQVWTLWSAATSCKRLHEHIWWFPWATPSPSSSLFLLGMTGNQRIWVFPTITLNWFYFFILLTL